MFRRMQTRRYLSIGALLLVVSACGATPQATAAPTALIAPTTSAATRGPATSTAQAPTFVATNTVAPTMAATDTVIPTAAATDTIAPTDTVAPTVAATDTVIPTAAATDTVIPTAAATDTVAPAAPPTVAATDTVAPAAPPTAAAQVPTLVAPAAPPIDPAANQPAGKTAQGPSLPRGALTKRPWMVMIDNHPDAYPQSGLDKAAVVFEGLAEYGITRYIATYADGLTPNATQIGPVRSTRVYFAQWAMGFHPLYAHAGGSPDGLKLVEFNQPADQL